MPTVEFTVKPLSSPDPLSKSKFVHGMQCPLYVLLEVRTEAPRPEPAAGSSTGVSATTSAGRAGPGASARTRASTPPSRSVDDITSGMKSFTRGGRQHLDPVAAETVGDQHPAGR